MYSLKRAKINRFSILILCSILFLMNVATIRAAEPGYERFSWPTQVLPTLDGNWTSANEWTDGNTTQIGNLVFRSTWEFTGDFVYTRFVVEILSDNTNDAGDYWQMCLDGDQSGGTAPQAGDYKFEIVNHTDLTWYVGSGTGWTQVALDASEIQWANSISASPTSSTPHWILEFTIPKNGGTVQLGIYWNFRLAAYDASSSTLTAWPPTSADDPSRWGIENYSGDPIPEALSFGVVVLLSSAAIIIATFGFRKRLKKT